MAREQVLTVSLEEFGLSRYEAKVYVTMITKGTMSASELAYHAKVPRTKVYPTLLKLERKQLVILSKSKPIMCTATSPEDAFDEAIHDQIDKVNAMNSLVSDLKRASEESKRAHGSEERRYLHIASNGVLDQLRQMIEGAKKSILIMVDQWGLGLLSECREQLVGVARRNLEIKVIIPPGQMGSEAFRKIPSDVKVRAAEGWQNCFVFDQTEVLLIDSDSGKGAVFLSTDILASSQAKAFNHTWRTGIRTSPMADMTKAESQEIYKMIKAVSEDGLGHAIRTVGGGKGLDILKLLEQNGIGFGTKTLDDVIEMVDVVMRVLCSGHATFDTKNRSISIESRINGGHSMPWVSLVDEYLHGRGYRTRLAYHGSRQKGEKVHIKIQQ